MGGDYQERLRPARLARAAHAERKLLERGGLVAFAKGFTVTLGSDNV
jgi:hypothetical protein